ncbi:MAG: heavy metal-associated domain-containing protein [Coriobacteriia bacterium]|jgi:copper chaperone CopZ|nr:heavy metal-associated domain-containing protein [Coriobacteriia bacterium]
MSIESASMTPLQTAEVALASPLGDEVQCAECDERLRVAVTAMEGVHRALIDPDGRTISVTYDPNEVPEEVLRSAVETLALEIGAGVAHVSYRLSGLD